MSLVVSGLLFLGLVVNVSVLFLSSSRLFNWLVVLENMNVLLLFCSLLVSLEDFRVYFIVLMVIFTVEVVLALVVLTRLWDFGGLVDFMDW